MKTAFISIRLISAIAMMSVGCGSKEINHYFYIPSENHNPEESVVIHDGKTISRKDLKNNAKSMLLSEIVGNQLSIDKKNEFLASSLIYLIQSDFKKPFQLKRDYIQDFKTLDEVKLLIDASQILDQKVEQAVDASERYKQFLEHQSDLTDKRPFNSFEVAKLIENVRNAHDSIGRDAAENLLNSRLTQWSPVISGLIFDVALKNDRLKSSFQKEIGEFNNGMFVIPKLDSSLKEIAKVLPESTEIQKLIKKQFSRVDEYGLNKHEFERAIKTAILKDTQKTSQDIKSIIKNKDKFEKAQNVFDRVDSALDLGATAYQIAFGKSQEVQKIVSIARSVVEVTKAVNSINFGKIGANLATGNIIGAVNDIVGSLFGGASGLDPETKQMLQNIQNDIADLRVHVDKRFDDVIEKLDDQLKLLQQIDVKLDKVQYSLNELTEEVSQISQKIDQGFDSIFENEFKSHYVNCFRSSLNVPGDLGHLRDCMDYFFHYASNSSMMPQRTGFFTRVNDLPLSEIDLKLVEFGSLNKFGFLDVAMDLIFDRFDSNGKPKMNLNLVKINISDFIIGTESYLSLVKSNPGVLKNSEKSVVANIELLKSIAKQIQLSLLRLSSQEFLSEKANEYFIEADLLSGSKDFRKDYKILYLKYKLLINLMKVADPANVYKLPEFENLFVLSDQSDLHVDLLDYTIDRKGDVVDADRVFTIRNRINLEAVAMKSYLHKRYQESNARGTVSTLIDPVLDHIEMVEQGLRPRF